MTNGEKIKEIFPSTDSRLDEKTGIMLVKWVDGATKCFKADWWNAEYEERIKALEQEPILNKIRAEIKALSPEPTAYDVVDGNPVKDAVWETLIEVDKIIDKYKAESEE